jgi:hypothetical protein
MTSAPALLCSNAPFFLAFYIVKRLFPGFLYSKALFSRLFIDSKRLKNHRLHEQTSGALL